MRKVILSGIITAGLMVFAACGQQAATDAENTANTEVSAEVAAATVELSVDGMMCSHGCVTTIEKALGNTAGVQFASVNFDEGSAKVEYNAEEISEEEIIGVINELHDGIYTAKLASWDGSETEEGEAKSGCSKPCDPSSCTAEQKAACSKTAKTAKTDCAKSCSSKGKMSEA